MRLIILKVIAPRQEELVITNQKEKFMRSVAQDFINKGIQQGKQEGRKERNLEIAKDMRSAGYKADETARLTGLPLSEINNS